MRISFSAGSVNSETAFMIKTDTEKAKEAIMWKTNKGWSLYTRVGYICDCGVFEWIFSLSKTHFLLSY